jgi:hypothetical protein
MSEYEIIKILEGVDREYLAQAKAADSIHEKKFAQKARFVVGKIKRDFTTKFNTRSSL